MNIQLSYLYRDGGNYKFRGEVVFANANGADPEVVAAKSQPYLIDECWFVAEQVGLPDLRPQEWDDEIDHYWHEVSAYLETDAEPDDPDGRDIADFLQALREASYKSAI